MKKRRKMTRSHHKKQTTRHSHHHSDLFTIQRTYKPLKFNSNPKKSIRQKRSFPHNQRAPTAIYRLNYLLKIKFHTHLLE